MDDEKEDNWTTMDSKKANRITALMFLFLFGWVIFLLMSLAPSCPQARTAEDYFNYGKHYATDGDYIQAQRYFTKAIKIKPDFKDAYHERIRAWEQTDSIQNIINDYNVLIGFTNNTVNEKGELLYLRGSAYYAWMKDSLACNDWKQSRDLGYNKAYDKVRFICK